MSPAIRKLEDVTPEFLSQALGATVASYSSERIGTGLVGKCYRISLDYAPCATGGPASVVIKLAASDPASRKTGWQGKLYEHEARFYSEIAPGLNSPSIPKCYHALVNENDDTFHLLLEDIHPASIGNELTGATLEQARSALTELAKLQKSCTRSTAPAWLQETVPLPQAFMQQIWAMFVNTYQDAVKAEHRRVCERFLAVYDNYCTQQFKNPNTLSSFIHGDNMLFNYSPERPFIVVDWQTVCWGPFLRDVAYFLGCALLPEIRRAHGQDLLRQYYDALGPDQPFTFEECQEGVRRQSFLGLSMAFMCPVILGRTERGDDMFILMLDRLVQQILDLDALATLPEPRISEPLQPDPKDETSHPPGKDPLHNESWYFDVADTKQGIGLWIRLGLTPNQPGSWYTAVICGPGRPTVAVVDFQVSVQDDLTINTDRIHATHTVESPLARYRVILTGHGESFDDPADLLRGETSGKPVSVEVDLTWHTSGIPYQWRLATRYEIPCTVTGTIKIGDEVTTISHAVGQRDHSWGPRDWWDADWAWTAFHLDDGTHLHGVDFRPKGSPRLGIGYIQGKDVPITVLTDAVITEEVDEEHLVREAEATYSFPGGEDVVLYVKPLGLGPLRLVAVNGRISYLLRCFAEVCTKDGRRGVGWIEWNHVQS